MPSIHPAKHRPRGALQKPPQTLRLLTGLLLLTIGFASEAESADLIPSECRQAVVVIADDWSASTGLMRRFLRAGPHDQWSPTSDAASVLIGQNGLGWASGLLPITVERAPRKVEGDRRSPAGMFFLMEVFSRQKIEGLRMRSITLTPTMEAIDDPRSRYYNRIVDRKEVTEPDWRSSEHMADIPSYEIGVVIGANPARESGGGSCIFLHLWTGNPDGTAGCTALHREDLLTLVHWLDASKHPILIQLPKDAARILPAPLGS